jgi:hypothetical protein
LGELSGELVLTSVERVLCNLEDGGLERFRRIYPSLGVVSRFPSAAAAASAAARCGLLTHLMGYHLLGGHLSPPDF